MYLKEAKDYFPEIDKEWDLERLFQDFRSANKGKQPTLNVQIVLKGLIGGYSPREIGQFYRGFEGQKEPGSRIRVCINTYIIPVIKLMVNTDEAIKSNQISRLLSRYKFLNNSMDLSLKNILLKLDYTDQTAKFDKSLETLLVGTFAIHGKSSEYGQVLLLNRIFYESNSSEDYLAIKINFRHYQKDLQGLWNYLGNQLGQQNLDHYSTEEIINSVVAYWDQSTTRKLWFSFYLDFKTVTSKMGDFLTEFMQNFWYPLVQKITAISNNCCSSLYLFFVDEHGNLENWKPYLKIADGDEPILSEANIEQAYYPIDLGPLEDWSWQVVRPWVNKYYKYLMTILPYDEVDAMAELKSIFDQNKPISAIRQICNYCDQSYDIMAQKEFKL